MPETVFQRLAAIEPSDLPILSMYLDVRPQTTGENPALRPGLVVLKDRLREIEKTLGPRGPALDSFHTDTAMIDDYLTHSFTPETRGLAIFACAGRSLFEVVDVGIAFEDHVAVGPTPDLFQLARLLDDQETSVVAVVDTNTARLFVTHYGRLDEVQGPNDTNAKMYRKRSMGGWKQMHYQRNIDNNRTAFARIAAEAIEHLMKQTNAIRLILAGDEVSIPLLKNALPQHVVQKLYHEVLRIDMRTPSDEVQEEVVPLLAQAERDADHTLIEQVIDAVRSNGLGVVGGDHTLEALENGQVDTLLLTADGDLDHETRNDLIRRASSTGATIEVVEAHETFAQLGGVGGLLRYRYAGQKFEQAME